MTIADVSDQYYTYEGRLASFQSAQPLSKRRSSNLSSKAPRSIKWPHSFLAAEQMAKVGFFHYPSQECPDNVVCFLCRRSMDGWEEDDDPLAEHLKHSPECGWAIVASIDARDAELSQEYPSSMRMVEARKATFADRWPHENKKSWKCKTKQMVEAGWKYTPTPEYDDMATCAYCGLALDGWEPSDKPLDEHRKRSPDCAFFALISNHQEATNAPKNSTKSRKSRASKSSRLSAQSTFTIISEAPSILDLAPEVDDSILTTATNVTVISQSGRKMAKGKKPAKGRKTKSKKEDTVEVGVDMEPEDAGFEVKVEQPKAIRGKKRPSEDMHETPTFIDIPQPPAKRRGMRNARGSVAATDNSLAPSLPEKDADEVMSPADATALEKAIPNRKKGRPSNVKARRDVSSASTASKATLRMNMPDDDEIDRALQADLERPLTDEEDEHLRSGGSKTRQESQLKKPVAAASTAPVGKATRSSKVHKGYDMFAIGDISIDEGAIDAELRVMEMKEIMQIPKAKGTKGKQPRKPSAKQQAASKQAADAAQADINVVEDMNQDSNGVEADRPASSFSKSRRGRNTGSLATSRRGPGRTTRASAMSVSESNNSLISGSEEIHDSGNDSEASMASHSTVVRGEARRQGSGVKKTKSGRKAKSQNIKEIVHQSVDKTTSQQDVEEALPKKRAGRPKKVVDSEELVFEDEPQPMMASVILQEPLEQQLATKLSKAKPGKATGKSRALPDPPVGTEVGPPRQGKLPAPESPKQPLNNLTPSLSPQSSDAENLPPSSKTSTIKQVVSKSQVSSIPLAPSIPTKLPTKCNITAQSSYPWTTVDLDEILLHSPSDALAAEKENAMSGLLAEAVVKVKKGELTSPEKRMTVEEWIMYNASLAEEKLRGECERMVGIFEREGGRAMRVLEGVACTD